MAGKDAVLLCLSSRDQGRPTTFASLPGSGNLLVTLRRSTGGSYDAARAAECAVVSG